MNYKLLLFSVLPLGLFFSYLNYSNSNLLIDPPHSVGNLIRFSEPTPMNSSDKFYPIPNIQGSFDQYLFKGSPFSGWNPPDSAIAVSPTRVLIAVNGRVVLYSKSSDSPPSQLDFSSLHAFVNSQHSSAFIYDPRAIFDQDEQKFVVVTAQNTRAPSFITFTYSLNSEPNKVLNFLTPGDWITFEFNVDEGTGWCDYPTLAIDKFNMYVTCNMFTVQTGKYPSMLFVFNKQDIYNNVPNKRFWKLHLRNGNFNVYSVQPSVGTGLNTDQYLLSRNSANSLALFKIIDPETNPSLLFTRIVIPTLSSGVLVAKQPGNVEVYPGDTRMMNSFYRNGKVYGTFHHTKSGGGLTVSSSVFEIDPISFQVLYNKEYTFEDSNFFFPCVSVNNQGRLILLTHESSLSRFITLSLGIKNPGENTISSPNRIYQETGFTALGRYGDYSSCTVDPNGSRFWLQAIMPVGNKWETLILSFDLEEDSSCNPTCQFGVCSNETCICNPNYIGETCNQCKNGFYSIDCLPCQNCGELDNQGFCDQGLNGTGVCICNEEWGGPFCNEELCDPRCQGECIDGLCICDSGMFGEFCDQISCVDNCDHGSCNSNEICICDNGWKGEFCNLTSNCNPNCINGNCVEELGLCYCGPDPSICNLDCSNLNCNPVCKNGGVCNSGQCNCLEGYSGNDCSIINCNPICKNGGVCNSGQCNCLEGYSGNDCSIINCNPKCNTFGGFCEMGICNCNENSCGNSCEFVDCNNCNRLTGNCNRTTGNCDCKENYMGSTCETPNCNCNIEGGLCNNQGNCECYSGYKGPNCNELNCGSECLNEGICIKLGGKGEYTKVMCMCNENYTGEYCQEEINKC